MHTFSKWLRLPKKMQDTPRGAENKVSCSIPSKQLREPSNPNCTKFCSFCCCWCCVVKRNKSNAQLKLTNKITRTNVQGKIDMRIVCWTRTHHIQNVQNFIKKLFFKPFAIYKKVEFCCRCRCRVPFAHMNSKKFKNNSRCATTRQQGECNELANQQK